MSAFREDLPEAPPGIDPEVLSRINMLLHQDTVPGNDESDTSSHTTEDAGSDSEDEVSNCPGAYPESEPTPEDGGQDHSKPPRPTPPPPKIIARYTYPSEHRVVAPLRQPPAPPPSLFGRIATYVSSYFDTSPAIIEYTDRQIKRQAKVRVVEAQHVKYATDEKVVRVVALVSNGALDEAGEVKARQVEIRAKHRRVRQLLRDEGMGGYVAEEVYSKEIRGALRRLRSATV